MQWPLSKVVLQNLSGNWWDETVPTVVTRAEPHNQPYCTRRKTGFFPSGECQTTRFSRLLQALRPHKTEVYPSTKCRCCSCRSGFGVCTLTSITEDLRGEAIVQVASQLHSGGVLRRFCKFRG